MVKSTAVIFNIMQRDTVWHHFHVLPFVSEAAERLWGA
jgi:hypothetical protein